MRIAVFPGSFDPMTQGHEDVIKRALPLFDRLIVAVGKNAAKNSMFPLEQRMLWIKDCFPSEPKLEVMTYNGLTVNFCKEQGAGFIVRGLRNPADFEFEKAVAQTNRKLEQGVETVFFLTSSGLSSISSSIVRDVIRNGGDYTLFVPASVRI